VEVAVNNYVFEVESAARREAVAAWEVIVEELESVSEGFSTEAVEDVSKGSSMIRSIMTSLPGAWPIDEQSEGYEMGQEEW
jgi:hypothetical protein